MTREQLIQHMTRLHHLAAKSSTEELIARHASDHESVISVLLGVADHQHSEYLEVDGIPAFQG